MYIQFYDKNNGIYIYIQCHNIKLSTDNMKTEM
jgi:hypothetical protein